MVRVYRSNINEKKWALFFCDPKESLENGLLLIHTDVDVHTLFGMVETNESVDIFIAHKPQKLAQFYLKNISFEVVSWVEQDAKFRMLSQTPFRTRRQWQGIDKKKMQGSGTRTPRVKGGVVIKDEEGVVAKKREKIKGKGKGKMVDEEDVLPRKKGREVVQEFKRGLDGKGKAKMVEFAGFDVENLPGFDVEGKAERVVGAAADVSSSVNTPFRSKEKITNCVLALFAQRRP